MIYVSSLAHPRLLDWLAGLDDLTLVGPLKGPSEPVSCHPDLLYCRLGAGAAAPVFKGREEALGPVYPADCVYNAAVCGRYLIHKKGPTDPALLEAAKEHIRAVRGGEMLFVPVPQGYTKCNIAVVDEDHVITSDRGIAKALAEKTGIDCLLIPPGGISLPPYGTGFIGGCCGRAGDVMIFSGDLSAFRSGSLIRSFISGCGLEIKEFPGLPLADIGSIISAEGILSGA